MLENYARYSSHDEPVVIAAFQHAHQFTPATLERYRALAGATSFVAGLGVGEPDRVPDGMRWAPIAEGHPLRDEWVVVVLGSHSASALVARDLGDRGPEHERRFDYLVTHDRDIVISVAQRLARVIAGDDAVRTQLTHALVG